MRDVRDACLIALTEDELVEWYRSTRQRIVQNRGKWWTEHKLGFCQPLHPADRFRTEETRKPKPLCWGYQAGLVEEQAEFANGFIPLTMMRGLAQYNMQSLSANRRSHLRKCQKRVSIVWLPKADALQNGGYEVFLSARSRTAYGKMLTDREYRDSLAHYDMCGKGIVLAGYVDGRLAGYLTGYAVESVAYVQRVVLSTEFLNTHVGTGLTFEFVQLCQRSGSIKDIVHGLHTPENPDLTRYKRSLGFEMVPLPCLVRILPGIAAGLRWRSPYKYYRITGHLSGVAHNS